MGRHRSISAFALMSGCALLAMAPAVMAALTGVDTANPSLPPDTGAYLSPSQVHATYTGAALQVVLSQISHQPFANQVDRKIAPDGTNQNETETFGSSVTRDVSITGGPQDVLISLTGPVTTEVFGKVGNVTGTFATEMLSLDLSGNTPLGPIMIRESPTLASTGQSSVTDIGGGMYHIDSFFDVFTELSVDGGQTWIPSTGSTHVDLMNVPEPASLGLLFLGGLVSMKRRRQH